MADLCYPQYGRIAHIDLKVPPRPPGYAFVEVSLEQFFFLFFFGFHLFQLLWFLRFVCYSLKTLKMLKMPFGVVMAMILMGIGYGLVTCIYAACIDFMTVGLSHMFSYLL
jgi:hypothetical protein